MMDIQQLTCRNQVWLETSHFLLQIQNLNQIHSQTQILNQTLILNQIPNQNLNQIHSQILILNQTQILNQIQILLHAPMTLETKMMSLTVSLRKKKLMMPVFSACSTLACTGTMATRSSLAMTAASTT
jgi:hypothetical protein